MPSGEIMMFLGFGNAQNGSLPNAQDLFQEGTMVVSFQENHWPIKSGVLIIDCKQISSHFIQVVLVGIPKLVPLYMVNTALDTLYIDIFITKNVGSTSLGIFTQKMNSIRLSKIYIVYQFPMLATIISLVKKIPILKKKIGDRVS